MRLLAVVVVLAAVVVVLWVGGPDKVAGMFGSSRPSVATDQPTAVGAAPGQQTIQITESELSQQLTQQLSGQSLGSTPLGPATLSRITTHLSDGELQADGDARAGSTSVPVSLKASGMARDGRAILQVDDLRAAGVPMPSSARDSVQQAIQKQIDQQVDQMQMRVSSVAIGDGKLTLVGSKR